MAIEENSARDTRYIVKGSIELANLSYRGGHGVVLHCGQENDGNAGRDFGGACLLIGCVYFHGLIADTLGSLGNLFIKSCPLSLLMRSSPLIERLL